MDLRRLDANVRALRQRIAGTACSVPHHSNDNPAPAKKAPGRKRPSSPSQRKAANTDGRIDPPSCFLCGVVKKNGYGLGAAAIASRLMELGCEMLAVYCADEALPFADEAFHHQTPVLLLMPELEADGAGPLRRLAAAGLLHFTIHDPDQLRPLDALGHKIGRPVPAHLFLDTGMSRLGMNEDQLRRSLAALGGTRFIAPVGICSHLACADDDPLFTDRQRREFERLSAIAQPVLGPTFRRHLANTFATLRDRTLHMDMVRCGLGLLGYGLEATGRVSPPPVSAAELSPVSPVLRWVSRLIHVQRYGSGCSVGYGATWTLQRESVLGVVPVGYGDGYPLGLSNGAAVRIFSNFREFDRVPVDASPCSAGMSASLEGLAGGGSQRLVAVCPVLGRVNMDQIVIDLTDVPLPREELWRCEVELIGHDATAPNALPTLAAAAGLHSYALLCQLGSHLPRRYLR